MGPAVPLDRDMNSIFEQHELLHETTRALNFWREPEGLRPVAAGGKRKPENSFVAVALAEKVVRPVCESRTKPGSLVGFIPRCWFTVTTTRDDSKEIGPKSWRRRRLVSGNRPRLVRRQHLQRRYASTGAGKGKQRSQWLVSPFSLRCVGQSWDIVLFRQSSDDRPLVLARAHSANKKIRRLQHSLEGRGFEWRLVTQFQDGKSLDSVRDQLAPYKDDGQKIVIVSDEHVIFTGDARPTVEIFQSLGCRVLISARQSCIPENAQQL